MPDLNGYARRIAPFVFIREEGDIYGVGLNILFEPHWNFLECVHEKRVWSGIALCSRNHRFRWRYSRAQSRHLISWESMKLLPDDVLKNLNDRLELVRLTGIEDPTLQTDIKTAYADAGDGGIKLHDWVSLPIGGGHGYHYVICGDCGVTKMEIEDNLGHQRCHGSPRARVAMVARDVAKANLQQAKDRLAEAQGEYDAAIKAAQSVNQSQA